MFTLGLGELDFCHGQVLVVGVGCSECSGGAGPECRRCSNVRHGLETELKGKQLPIRGFPGEPVIRYAWKAGRLEAAPEQVFTLGVFGMESVKIHAVNGLIDRATLWGHRRTLSKADVMA